MANILVYMLFISVVTVKGQIKGEQLIIFVFDIHRITCDAV